MNLLAHIVEHELGFTLRLDRLLHEHRHAELTSDTVVGAMMPHANEAMWSLPRVDWIDVSLYPCVAFDRDGTTYVVAMVFQTKR